MDTIEVRIAPELSGEDAVSFASPAIVEVDTKDGQCLRCRVAEPRGGPSDPLATEDLRDKFMQCARGVLGEEGAEQVSETVLRLDELRDIQELMVRLRVPSR
jgi:2-methylcitrate dehydratase PrpD